MDLTAIHPPGATRLLPCDVKSVPEARRLGAEVAGKLMTERQGADLALALSEIVSNAVRHSGADEAIELTMTPKDGYLCVQVTDAGTGLMARPGAMKTEGGAGVGLFLVEQLTRRWGMTREGERTRVWFEIDFAAAS